MNSLLPLGDRVCIVRDHGRDSLDQNHWEGIEGCPGPVHAIPHG